MSASAIREQALYFYDYLKEKNSESSANESFNASRGWFDRFRKRFGLHSISFVGESLSADHEAAKQFPLTVKKLIDEKG